MKKKALVLAGGLPQIKLLRELRGRGYETLLADYTSHPIAEAYADAFFRESTLDVDAIRRIAREEDVDLVTTCCTDQALNTVATVSEQLGLPCYIGSSTGMAVTNKTVMKRVFSEHGIPTAGFAVLDGAGAAEGVSFPCVVKPADCNSSRGVVKVCDSAARDAAVAEAARLSRTGAVVVEEYLEGEELSVDAFVTCGRARVLCVSRSDKIPDDSAFVIQRSVYSREEHERLKPQVEPIVQQIADAFSLRDCPMLVQMIECESSGDLRVLEFSARTGGCSKYRLIDLACGVDIVSAMLDATLEGGAVVEPLSSGRVVADEFVYCTPGTYMSLGGFESCVSEGLIDEYHALRSPGSPIGAPSSSGDRAASVLISSETMDAYVRRHVEAAGRLSVIGDSGEDLMRHDLYDGMARLGRGRWPQAAPSDSMSLTKGGER